MSCFTQIYCLSIPRTGGGGGGESVWTEAEKDIVITRLANLIAVKPDHKPAINAGGEVILNVNQESAIRSREL